MTRRTTSVNRKMYMDLLDGGELPKKGDVIAAQGVNGNVNSCYLVLTARQVKRRDVTACPRVQMLCQIIDRSYLEGGDAIVWLFRWYPRRKKRDKKETAHALRAFGPGEVGTSNGTSSDPSSR